MSEGPSRNGTASSISSSRMRRRTRSSSTSTARSIVCGFTRVGRDEGKDPEPPDVIADYSHQHRAIFDALNARDGQGAFALIPNISKRRGTISSTNSP